MSISIKVAGYDAAMAHYGLEKQAIAIPSQALKTLGNALFHGARAAKDKTISGLKTTGRALVGQPIRYAKELPGGKAFQQGGVWREMFLPSPDSGRLGRIGHWGMTAGFPLLNAYSVYSADEADRGEMASRALGSELLGLATLPTGLVGNMLGYAAGDYLGGLLYSGAGSNKDNPTVRQAEREMGTTVSPYALAQPDQLPELPKAVEIPKPTLESPKTSNAQNVTTTATAPVAQSTPPAPAAVNPISPAASVPDSTTPTPNSTVQNPSGMLLPQAQLPITGVNPAMAGTNQGAGPGPLTGGAQPPPPLF